MMLLCTMAWAFAAAEPAVEQPELPELPEGVVPVTWEVTPDDPDG